MLSAEQIRTKIAKLQERLKTHDAKRKTIEARIEFVRNCCPHENVREWDHYDYGGGCDHHWVCSDCKLSKVT